MMKLRNGWDIGKVVGTTKATNLNYVIAWDDEPREKIKKLLKLDNYNGSNYAALYPWCIISEQPVDWSVETNIRTRKRRRL